MPRFAANLSMMYTEHPFIERFAAAAADGFGAVEFLFPYDFPAATIAAQLKQHGLQQVLFNAPPGDFAAGERGTCALPGREAEFRNGIERALEYTAALSCPRLHVMAGLVPEGSTRASLRGRYVDHLAFAAERAGAAGVDVLIEPINTRDIPGYLLNRQDDAHAVLKEVGSPHLKVQMDLYHCQIVEGDVAMKLKTFLPTGNVGHLQVAGVPDRHEPDGGELNYEYLFGVIDALAFPGWIGCEYRPAGATSAGLGWLRGRQRMHRQGAAAPPAR